VYEVGRCGRQGRVRWCGDCDCPTLSLGVREVYYNKRHTAAVCVQERVRYLHASVREGSSNTKCHSGRRTVRPCVYEVISNVTRVYVVTRHNICTVFTVYRGDLSTTKVESRWLV